MTYRRPERETVLGRQWLEFARERISCFSAAGLPGVLADDRFLFDYFLMHGATADGSGVRLSDLRPDQRRALDALVDEYVDRFYDPGLVPGLRTHRGGD